MRELWQSILEFFESIGRAKAAAELTRLGRHEEARRLFEEEQEVHP